MLLLFVPTILTASQKRSETITIVYGLDCVPFHFQNSDKQPDGIIIDKWKLFSQKTGIDIKFTPAAWEDTLKMVKNGGADVHAGLFFSKQRDTYLDYGPAMLTSQTHMFWDKRLPSPSDLNAFKAFSVGVIKEDFSQTWLETHMPDLHLITCSNNDDMMAAIQRKAFLVFAGDTLTALHYLRKYDLRPQFKFHPNTPLYSNDFFPAVKQGNTKLLKVITAGLQQITSAESRHIAREWASGQKKSEVDTLIIAMDRASPPMTMMDTHGNPSGLLVDMWRLWSRQTQTPITFRPSSWKQSVDAVKTGEADVHAGLFKNDERHQWMAFSMPIHRSETALFFKDLAANTSLKDLAGYRVGALSGSYQATYLKRHYPKIETVPQKDGEAMIFSLLKGDVAAILHETLTLEADLNRMGLSGRLKKGSRNVMNNTIHAGVAKHNKKMRDLINEGFAAIGQKKLAEIENKWIPRRENRYYAETSQSLVLTEKEKRFLADHSPLTFSEANWKPMSIVDEADHFDGIIADYLNLITQRSGLGFTFRKSDTWIQVLQHYVDGDIDVVPALGKTDKIGRPILISKPFVRFPFVIVTLDNVAHISDVAHLKNRRVAVGKGYSSYHYLKDNYPDIELVQTDDVKSGLLMVTNRRVWAFIGHMAVVTSCIQENGLTNLKIAGETDYAIEHCIGVDPQYPEAVSVINKVLETMGQQEHQKIYNRWLGVHYEKGIDYSLVAKVIAGSVIFLGFILYWNRKLSKEVAERKSTEQRLMENEGKTRAMSEAIHDGLVMIDENAKVMYWNHAAEKLFGISAQQAMGKDMHTLIAPEQYIEKATNGLKRFAQTGQGAVVGKVQELTARHSDGSTIPVEVGVSAFRMGNHWYAVGTLRDITERLNAQKALKESEQRIKTILNAINTGTIILDPENRTIADVNPVAAKMIGLPKDQIVGQQCRQFISMKDDQHCPELPAAPQDNNAEWELIAADQTRVPILNAVVPVVLDGKKMLLQSFVDLTSQKAAEKERHENLKELERFYKMAIDREEKMIDLKAEVNHLLLQTGQKEKYIVR